jgi:hypothetical protein
VALRDRSLQPSCAVAVGTREGNKRQRTGRGRVKAGAVSANLDNDAWTPIGIGLFSWELWRLMSPAARTLWLTLYASPAARRCPPGLWEGGPAAMAESGELAVDVTVVALAELERIGAVEYDADKRVARLIELPDRLSRADNPNWIRGWWRAWRNMSRCAVTLRHVVTLRWLMGAMKEKHAKAWAETFGTLNIPGAGVDDWNGSGNGSPNRSDNGSPNGSGNPWDPDQDLLSGDENQIRPGSSGEITSRARASEPDPVLAPVLEMAVAAHERHLRARHGGRGGAS